MENSAANESGGGFLQSIVRLLDGLAGAVHDRVELVRADAQAEKARLLESILLALTMVCLGTLGLLLLTFSILFFAWQGGFYLALACLIIGYGAGAFAAWRRLRWRMNAAPFPEVADQLARDRKRLQRLGCH
jgi:uncharacterized membrane protein YqjE